jgi:hypothetical protein
MELAQVECKPEPEAEVLPSQPLTRLGSKSDQWPPQQTATTSGFASHVIL